MTDLRKTARTRLPEPVSQTRLDEAIAHGQARRKVSLQALGVEYLPASRALAIRFADQSTVLLPIKNYPELALLSEDALGNIKVGLAGSALVLKDQDLHVSIAGMVEAAEREHRAVQQANSADQLVRLAEYWSTLLEKPLVLESRDGLLYLNGFECNSHSTQSKPLSQREK